MAGFNLGNLFRNTQQVQIAPPQGGQQAPQQPQQPQQQPQQPQGAPGSSMQQQQPGQGMQQQPGNTGSTGQQPQNASLDPFTDMWKTDPNAKPNPANADPFSEPLFQTDPAKIREAAGKMDFLSMVPQELMQKAMSGNDPQAFMSVINSVAQQSLATALQLGTATTEQAGRSIGERFNKSLPNRFRDMQIDAQAPENAALAHPAAQPMLKMARQQIKMMNPDFTPEQVNKQAEQYIMAMSTAMTGGNTGGAGGGDGGNSGADGMDWGSWVQSQAGSNS